MIRVEEYKTRDGTSPFADWFNDLDAQAANKVNTYLTRIEQGNTSSLKLLRGVFQEVRIDWGPGYRVYVGKDGKILKMPQDSGKNINKGKRNTDYGYHTKFQRDSTGPGPTRP